MRLATLLLASCVMFAQTTGKPGVTDPIKDPSQIPGNPNPGPIPQTTPPDTARAPNTTANKADSQKNKKKTKKEKKDKPTQPAK